MKKLYLILALVFTLGLVGCTSYQQSIAKSDLQLSGFESSQELKKFDSVEDLREFLKEAQTEQGSVNYYGGSARGMAMDAVMVEEAVAAPMAATKSEAGGGADDFSTTNVQVKGVDEADIVKNDNIYIYTLTQDKLVIVEAYPAQKAEISSETEIDGMPRNLFVNGDRLVVFTTNNEDVYVISEYDYIPRPRYSQQTHALVYDISDREDPILIKDYSLNGNFYQARMIGDYVYFITQENVYYAYNIIDTPVVRESGRAIISPEIYYFDNPETNYNFNTIASFDIQSDIDDINAQTFMMGYSNNLYVSQNNIYITYQKNLPHRYYREHNEERFHEIVVPLLPIRIQEDIKEIKDDDSLNYYEKWDEISSVLEEMYNIMDEDDKDDLIDEIEDAIEEYEIKLEQERRKSIIHKIAIDEGDIAYVTRGEVPGYLLNQFSMDEYDDYFRVATTTYIYNRRDSTMYNNVFVLDDELEIVGKIEDIAPDEKIYSTRFIGDRLYMVTFKRIDPLFVIDLSDPQDPEILGELKIPGFSDYLHPYDEDHIIGIGKETESNEWGGVSVGGVKLALFDVSDVENPKQVDKYEIGDRGSDSEALRDHKAFLFDKEKNILVIPVREVKENRYYDERYGYYRQRVWQGAYVFGLTPEDGFEKKGKITHMEGDEEDRWYWGSPNAVRRSLYMDDVLYTVSAQKILMNDMDDLDELNEIELPYKEQKYYPYPLY